LPTLFISQKFYKIMAKFLESEKRRISNYYVKSLYSLYEKGLISEDEMDILVEDIEIISGLTKSKEWKNFNFITTRLSLSSEEVLGLFNKIIFTDFKTEYSKKWFDEIINRNHYTIIDSIVSEFLKRVVILDIEVPEYIIINNERKNKIYSFVKKFYKDKIFNNGKDKFIKLHFHNVKTISNFEIDDDFKNLANKLFDFEINIIEKKLLTV